MRNNFDNYLIEILASEIDQWVYYINYLILIII